MRLEHSNLARLVPGTEETSLEVNWLDDEVKYVSSSFSGFLSMQTGELSQVAWPFISMVSRAPLLLAVASSSDSAGVETNWLAARDSTLTQQLD